MLDNIFRGLIDLILSDSGDGSGVIFCTLVENISGYFDDWRENDERISRWSKNIQSDGSIVYFDSFESSLMFSFRKDFKEDQYRDCYVVVLPRWY